MKKELKIIKIVRALIMVTLFVLMFHNKQKQIALPSNE
jgi:hypothetical protein